MNIIELIEQAAASGLPMLPAELRNPFNTTTYGTGAAFSVSLHAKLKSGIETVLNLIDFNSLLDSVDLVVTGAEKLYEFGIGRENVMAGVVNEEEITVY